MNLPALFTGTVLTFALAMQGCTVVGVDYNSPKVTTPDAWSTSLAGHVGPRDCELETWWKGFNDPVLNQLIERTREKNPTLEIAAQGLSEARSLRGVAQSQLLPTVFGGGEYLRNRASESLLVPIPQNPSDFYSTGFDAGWEIDVFGGIRRSIEAADANVDASTEDYRDLLVILYAETALNYIEYRTLERRIVLAKRNIDAQEKTVELTQSRLDAEIAPKLDVTQATTNLKLTRSLLPVLRTQLDFARNRLAALTGGFPGSVDALLAKGGPIPVPKRGYSAGLPCDLIRSRPDVRRAERRLAAATALIGVAEADLYPRFTLFGTFSLQSVNTSNFWDSASQAYSFGPAFSWQIFSAGRIRNNIDIQEARTEAAISNYERVVLASVEEVETSMSAVANGWDLVGELNGAVASAKETTDLVVSNYKEGLIDFQRVLDAERVRFTTEDAAAVAQGQVAKNYIALYKFLGGGSRVEVIPIAEPQVQANSLLSRIGRKPGAAASAIASAAAEESTVSE